MATAYYYAAHFNAPTTTLHHEPAILKLRAPTLAQQHLHMKDETLSQNMYIQAAQHLAKYGHMDYQSTSPLFRLPAELRNKIYTDLLCPETPISTSQLTTYTPSKKDEAKTLYPAILRSCKRIHAEASDMLYANIFSAHPALLTQSPYLNAPDRPVKQLSSIKKIKRWNLTIRLDTDPRFTKSQATEQFSGAEYFEIKVWQSMFDGADASVLGLFAGIRGVGVARVCGCHDGEVARSLEKMMMLPVEKDLTIGGPVGKEWFGGRDAWTFGNR